MSKTSTRHDDNVDLERVPRAIAATLLRRKARSLKPDENLMIAAAEGNPEAVAIVEAWRFKHPVRTVSSEEFEAMTERGRVTFHG